MKGINKKILQFFSVLADETRLKILLTMIDKPQTVNKIHSSLGKDKITLSGISHQLRQLSDLDIVVYEKKGREKYFQLSDDFCWCILKDAFNHFDSTCKCNLCSKSKNEIRGNKLIWGNK